MTKFSANSHRFDPYKDFKFRIKWDGRYVAGVSKAGAFTRSAQVLKHREGGDNSTDHKAPGRTSYDAVTLERGVTHDPEFEQWANNVWATGSGPDAEVSLKNLRRDLIIELYDEAGRLAVTYKLHKCWVSEYQALPDLDASSNAIAITVMKLEHEGWSKGSERARSSTTDDKP